MWTAVSVFALTYLLMSGGRLRHVSLERPAAALVGAVLMVVTGVLPIEEAYRSVDWNTIVLLLGMMILTAHLKEAGFFSLVAEAALARVRTPQGLLAAVVLLSGVLSALFVNDTVCLFLTPIVLEIAARAGLPAVPFLIALATSANVGGVATPTGNPQNMIVATASGIAYARFCARLLPVAALGLAANYGILRFLYRQELSRPFAVAPAPKREPADRRLLVVSLLVVAGTLAAYLAGGHLALVSISGAVALFFLSRVPPRRSLEDVDWGLLLFFASLFVVVAGLARTGAIDRLFGAVRPLLGNGEGRRLAVFSTFTVCGSQVLSNVPFVLVARHWIPSFPDADRMWLALAMASTLAGNLTLLGSVANVIVAELSRGRVRLGFREFLRVGVPTTVVTTAIGVAVLALA
ncbi:MAG TPA: anion transporter [Planctomycetota bacterium]|jgi:Na+/H+ antiporter NhaD/arsenite permease-like protein|nr:anion transporter [Planctomycetota bacterium]